GLIAHGLGRLRLGAARLREGRRMGRIRRDPGPLVAALRSARSILIVCHGNVIRSPFAARLLGQALGEGGQVSVGSAGLAPRPGTPSPPAAVAVAAARGVELRDHAASPLTTEAVAASDLIFVMEIRQLAEVRRRFPEASEKAFLLTCLAPETPLEVRDPVDREQPVFEDCYEHIARSVRPIRRLLVESGVAR
ncbi:MAG TPA: hypothetical protein VLI67_07230, partial [Vicinamibacteria bacterium]|nr:hypothetical protein [Vicinamibacteria bacterium]